MSQNLQIINKVTLSNFILRGYITSFRIQKNYKTFFVFLEIKLCEVYGKKILGGGQSRNRTKDTVIFSQL